MASGCEEDLTPRDDFDRPYTHYGVISPDLTVQSVRVYPIESVLSLDYADEPGITVTSTDLNTGEEIVWQDSTEIEPNGQREYIFWSRFRPVKGHRYRVQAARDADGALSYAEVSIPPEPSVQLLNADSIAIRVLMQGNDFRALRPIVSYTVRPADGDEFSKAKFYEISYQGKEVRSTEGWELTIQLSVDRYNVQSFYNVDEQALLGIRCGVLSLVKIDFNVTTADPAWDPPGGIFDPEILVYPETMTNVQNGLGFVGGGYRLQRSLFPGRKAVEEACFEYVW
jgi:hypothetical protein